MFDRAMDLQSGFQIEDPQVFIPWHIGEDAVRALLPSVKTVTNGYLTMECVFLHGLQHQLGFHFDRPRDGRLVEFEFFRLSYPDLEASYSEFQRHLEAAFGRPARSRLGDEGFPSHEWSNGGAAIRHYVLDRFGPEEHVRITKN